ncbi:hypothetical protein [Burkholderia cepacia]|nr:hypothetical protein [Burkholderia cepacia]MCA8323793.1 hypothetical protein [Burkholderia cepacia]
MLDTVKEDMAAQREVQRRRIDRAGNNDSRVWALWQRKVPADRAGI